MAPLIAIIFPSVKWQRVYPSRHMKTANRHGWEALTFGMIQLNHGGFESHSCNASALQVLLISRRCAKSWSSTVNEIEGVVTDADGRVVHSIFGKWHDSLYQGDPPMSTCIWRANPMPLAHEQYYGFTKFAVELNELAPDLRALLPPTDTRFRPDQRMLEEGNVDGAEEQKQRLEQLQRERRQVLQDNNLTHKPRFFRKSKDDAWVTDNTYWEQRRDPGFSKMDFAPLW